MLIVCLTPLWKFFPSARLSPPLGETHGVEREPPREEHLPRQGEKQARRVARCTAVFTAPRERALGFWAMHSWCASRPFVH